MKSCVRTVENIAPKACEPAIILFSFATFSAREKKLVVAPKAPKTQTDEMIAIHSRDT